MNLLVIPQEPSEAISGAFHRTSLNNVQAVLIMPPSVSLADVLEELLGRALASGEIVPCSSSTNS